MEKEIQKIIEQHLPEQTAGVMKEYIEGAELTEQELRSTQKELKNATELLEDYGKKEALLAEADDKLMAARDCTVMNERRKSELDEEARNMRCTIMEKELEMMTANMKNMESLVQKVFGHPSTSISKRVPVAEHPSAVDQYGNQSHGYVTDHDANEKSTEGKE